MPSFLQRLIALVALVIFLPFLCIVVFVSLIFIGPPVFYRSERAGQHGRVFRLFKFRSMIDGPEPDSERITPYGEFLRKTSIDELPSLFQVVTGKMNLVGPRPLLPEYNDLYDPTQRLRLILKPGITGWAQINGRNLIDWEQKFELDVWYVNNRSFLLDVRILIATVGKVLSCVGIKPKQGITMPKYNGLEKK